MPNVEMLGPNQVITMYLLKLFEETDGLKWFKFIKVKVIKLHKTKQNLTLAQNVDRTGAL